MDISTIEVTKYTDGPAPTVYGNIKATDSKGQEAALRFAVDTDDTKEVTLGLIGSARAHLGYNDQVLSKDASEDDFGYVFLAPTYEHNVITWIQVSQHWWSEDDYAALRAHLLRDVLIRLDAAQEAASEAFRDAMVNGVELLA